MDIKELREIAEHQAKYGRYMSIPPYRVKALLDCVGALQDIADDDGNSNVMPYLHGQARAALKALEAA